MDIQFGQCDLGVALKLKVAQHPVRSNLKAKSKSHQALTCG